MKRVWLIVAISGVLVFIIGLGLHAQTVTEPLEFTIHTGESQLQCYFYQTAGTEPATTVILLQGFPGGNKDVLRLGENLAKGHFNALTFHYRGSFLSTGEFSLDGTLKDIKQVIETLKSKEYRENYLIDTANIVLGGYSLGGGLALSYAAQDPEIKYTFSIAGTDHGPLVNRYQSDQNFANMINSVFSELEQPEGPVNGLKKEWDRIVANPGELSFVEIAAGLKGKNLLLIGGWDDMNNPMEQHLLPLYRLLKSYGSKNVQIKAYEADHSFSHVQTRLTSDILKWLKVQ